MTSESSTPNAEVALLFTPLGTYDAADCAARLTTGDPSTDGVLVVAYERSPETLLERWRSRVGDGETEFGVIAVGSDEPGDVPRLRPTDDRNVVALARPDCIGRLETAIYLFLDEWAADDRRAFLCFDSLTALLDSVDRTVAFRFLRSLTDYLWTLGAVAHFHVDPDAHDEETVAMLGPLFDTVVGGPTLDGSPVSPDVLSTLLGSRRRRLVCRYLAEVGDPVDASSLADRIAEWESAGVPSEDARERVLITLHHVHLPKLVEAGVVERDGDGVTATVDASELERYVRLAEADDAPPEGEPPVSDGRNLRTTEASLDDSNEAYWTVYGTAGDSIVVTLARALGAVSNVRPTELRPTLAEVIDVDALQRLAQREEVSVYAQFQYEGYDVVVDGGEIRLYESE